MVSETVQAFTNATMITPRLADLLATHRPFSVEVSLYGATRETYEAVTRVSGSYDRCLRGIRLLLERGLPLSLKTVACTLNSHELAQMQSLSDELGVRFRYDPDINPHIDGDLSPLQYRLTPEQVVELDHQTPARAREIAAAVCRVRPMPTTGEVPLYDCAAGETAFHINPYGDATSCIMTRQGGYDLRAGRFAEGWQTALAPCRAQTRRMNESEPATYRHCAGWAALEHGDPARAVVHAALTARLRERTFATLSMIQGELSDAKSNAKA